MESKDNRKEEVYNGVLTLTAQQESCLEQVKAQRSKLLGNLPL
jgi:hypothetical protein